MNQERQFTTFYLGDAIFGVDILLVNEIIRPSDITTVHGALDYVKGLINLRGQIVTIVDLAKRLNLEDREFAQSSRIIILKSAQQLDENPASKEIEDTTCEDVVGLVVDRIGDMVSIPLSGITPPPANINGISGAYIENVYRRSDDVLVLLKVKKILELENQAEAV